MHSFAQFFDACAAMLNLQSNTTSYAHAIVASNIETLLVKPLNLGVRIFQVWGPVIQTLKPVSHKETNMSDQDDQHPLDSTGPTNPTQKHYSSLATIEEAIRTQVIAELNKPPRCLILILDDSRVTSGYYARKTKWVDGADEVFTCPIPRVAFTDPGQVCIRVVMALLSIGHDADFSKYIPQAISRRLHSVYGIGVEKPEGDYWAKPKLDLVPDGKLAKWIESNQHLFTFFTAVLETHVSSEPIHPKPDRDRDRDKPERMQSSLNKLRTELDDTKSREIEAERLAGEYRAQAEKLTVTATELETKANREHELVMSLERQIEELQGIIGEKNAEIAALRAQLASYAAPEQLEEAPATKAPKKPSVRKPKAEPRDGQITADRDSKLTG